MFANLVNKVTISLVLLVSSYVNAQSHRKTLFVDGVYAASYGEITLDKGEFYGEELSLLRLGFGVQLLRWEDYVSLTIGYHKSGFYDGLHQYGSSNNDLQVDYQGLVADLVVFPHNWISGGLRYNINNTGTVVERVAPGDLDDPNLDARYRHNLSIDELALYADFRIWQNVAITVGAGSRSFSADYEISGLIASDDYNGDRTQDYTESGSFFYIGLKGTTL